MVMKQNPGVARAMASYPDHNVLVGLDKRITSEKAIREACGFGVA